jgi:membrane protease YdiL (CAAX protease family)
MTEVVSVRSGAFRRVDVIRDRRQWVRLVGGVAAVFSLFHASAAYLGSDRGQSGVLVGSLVIAATLLANRLVSPAPASQAMRALGLGPSRASGLLAAAGVGMLLLGVVPLFVAMTGSTTRLFPGWPSLLPGLFVQAGIAEEVLFRGFLFGHLRRGRSFWRAAALSMIPFAAVHLLIFTAMPWPVALAALLLSVVMSFPLARLFELGGRTIWAPALLHAIAQGTVKVVEVSATSGLPFPLLWMFACAALPMAVFAIPVPASER